MKETGIIMSGDHPSKILDGTKTMTRRVIKPQPVVDKIFRQNDSCICWNKGKDGMVFGDWQGFIENAIDFCPYGQVGDRLWVRETHYRYGRWVKHGFTKTGRQAWRFSPTTDEVLYYEDAPKKLHPNKTREEIARERLSDWYKRPSIFMPRWASRIERIINLLRAERLRDISEADARLEGGYTIEEFIKLYLKINHLADDANPWNWVVGW